MNEKHYKEELSRFVNHELATEARQAVAEHLLQCADCRAAHDEIKFGAALASELKQTDAPENIWYKIENDLDKKDWKVSSAASNFEFFNRRWLTAAAVLLIVGVFAAVYLRFLRNDLPETARQETPSEITNPAIREIVPTPDAAAQNPNANQTTQTNAANKIASNVETPLQPLTADSNIKLLPKTAPSPSKNILPVPANLPSWNVEALAGMPKAGNQSITENGKLTVGEFLETDANSKAKIQVANIGNVEIAPNSRVKLVQTSSAEHRLALEKGTLKAKILAPPRLFIVDTPSAAAVDLGCEYTLEVDADGNGRLHVTAGFVALERGGREAIVPAGAIAVTRKGKGVGTPFSEDASAALQDALYEFDFAGGGNAALQTIIREASLYDSLTLWHLLSKTRNTQRAAVFDALAAQIKPPAKVTRAGVLRLDKKMLDAWWKEIETVWFE